MPAGGFFPDRKIALENTEKKLFVNRTTSTELYAVSLGPGEGLSEERHETLTQVFFVVRGLVRGVVGEVTTLMHPGAMAVVPPGVVHLFENAFSRENVKAMSGEYRGGTVKMWTLYSGFDRSASAAVVF